MLSLLALSIEELLLEHLQVEGLLLHEFCFLRLLMLRTGSILRWLGLLRLLVLIIG